MSTSAQVSSEGSCDQSPIVEVPRKPLQGKYDGRRNNGRKRTPNKRGRKPIWEKHLSRNTAAKLFREMNVRERFAQFLSATTWVSAGRNSPPIEVPDMRLQFEVARYLWDRLEGKPFVAVNPAESKSPALHQDNRLQMAIQQLNIIPAKPEKRKRLASKTPELQAGDPSSREGGVVEEK